MPTRKSPAPAPAPAKPVRDDLRRLGNLAKLAPKPAKKGTK